MTMKKKTMVDKEVVKEEITLPVRVANQPTIKPQVPTTTPPVLNHLLSIIRKGS